MVSFERFDRRGYRVASAREGYARWSATYDDTVVDAMDLSLLRRITRVRWDAVRRCADLGCGTGRTAQWLASRGSMRLDGVDLTPEMLEIARGHDRHHVLVEADVRATGLEGGAYDLVVCSLVDEHLPDLGGLYEEARRLLVHPGNFVVVGFHPYFIMSSGMPTHFSTATGEPTAIETYIHLPSEHMAAASRAGFAAEEFHEGCVGDDLIGLKPSWERFRDWPFSFAWVWSTR